jgi:prolyl-tRNA editing enzyme YbaK/EbsC (Cys-tRNA(Pro) deacylase)
MLIGMSASIERVRVAARAHGLEIEVVTFPDAVRTAPEAADAVGCDVSRIVKSLVFLVGDEHVVALVPGDRRLDTHKLSAAGGSDTPARRASLDDVRAATGFVAGGTPPFGHVSEIAVYADLALRRHDAVWAAAGTPHTVFEITVDDLDRIARPHWADISES